MKPNRSVIQSSLLKITVLLFSIFLTLYFFIMHIYWDKAVAEKKYDLFSNAVAAETVISANLDDIYKIKQDKHLRKTQQVEDIDSRIIPELERINKENSVAVLGYYDLELDHCFKNIHENRLDQNCSLDHKTIAQKIEKTKSPQLISDSEIYGLDGNGLFAVAVPVLKDDRVIGHTWAMGSASAVYLNEYINYSLLFIPIIVLGIVVLVIVNKSINKIKISLDNFTQSILKDDLANWEEINNLPELKPVFDRIHAHMHSLQVLNRKLEVTNEKFVTIMEGISDGFTSLDPDWRFSFVNSKFKHIFNKEHTDLIGEVLWDALPEINHLKSASNLRQAVKEELPMSWEEGELDKAKVFKVYAYPHANGVTIFIRDITQNKQQEEEIKKLERLNLIGQMAAGISHEVRNPITTVRGFLQVLESRSDSSKDKEFMELMISEIDRANAIITDFLSLAKANVDSTKKIKLNDIIRRIYPMVQADAFNCNKEVCLEMENGPELELNESEIRQLLLNLVRNGLEVTPERGKVCIKTYLRGGYVVLAVKDEGPGIPQEIRDKIGTPFLTTKETGTGLGLAISIGIANRHKAKFDFETGENGTTFFVSFPIPKS